MSALGERRILAVALLALINLVGLSGCGTVAPEPVPVSGSVFLNDVPLPFARVVFHPQELTGRTGVAVTDIRGRFEIIQDDIMGLPPGQYSVTVSYYLNSTGKPSRPDATVDFTQSGWKQMLPPNYNDLESTELTALISDPEAQISNTFNLKLYGDQVTLPARARQPDGDRPVRDFADGEEPQPSTPSVVRTGSGAYIATLAVYALGAIFAIAAAVMGFRMLRKRLDTEDEEFAAYKYAGEEDEFDGDSPDQFSAEEKPAKKRRKKKRRKKLVRKRVVKKKTDSTDGEPSSVEKPSQQEESQPAGSPFPVLDEGMDEEDLAAALIAGEDFSDVATKTDSDTKIAQWVLEAGGFVKIQVGEEPAGNVKKLDDLPADDFRVLGAFFEGVENFSDDQLAKLDEAPRLDTLDLASTSITDRGLQALSRAPNLRTLALSRTDVTDAGLAAVSKLPELRILLLYRTKVTEAGIEHLKKLSKLKTLELKHTGIGKEGAELLQEALPKCKVIV